MKQKILLVGGNSSAIDDLFNQLQDNYEFMTTSYRTNDIINHVKYFAPSILIYCMGSEPYDAIKKIYSTKAFLSKHNIPFSVLGSEEDFNDFSHATGTSPDLSLIKPISASNIHEKIVSYFAELERLEEEARLLEEKKRLEMEAARTKHILVVDDDPMMLKLIKEHLHETYTVATAPSGKFALKFLESKATDLILLDYEMPGEDGPAVLEKLRANDTTKDIPVIFLTGITERSKIAKALVLKPQGYLLKPIERDKLIESIEGILGKPSN